jgi:hexulose-6-phosphate isomerase
MFNSKDNSTKDSQGRILPPGHNCLSRRSAIKAVLASAGAAAFSSKAIAKKTKRRPDPRKGSPKRYTMKKSINQWAFPYPQQMNLKECLQLAKDGK